MKFSTAVDQKLSSPVEMMAYSHFSVIKAGCKSSGTDSVLFKESQGSIQRLKFLEQEMQGNKRSLQNR